MEWDKPSPTITTQFYRYGTGRYGHPSENRALSLREGALLQTFPENYKFFKNIENTTFGTIGRHIGNAVPVDLGKIIGISIKHHLQGK
jgi:DNA (cytosine-5)-methyltransferase 1